MSKEIALFFEKLQEVYIAKLPFTVYKKPNEDIITLVIQKNTKLNNLQSFDESGFVFAPFYKNEEKIIFPLKDSSIIQTKILQCEELSVNEISLNTALKTFPSKIKEDYIKLVETAISFIKKGNAKKIVLSRNEILEFTHFSFITTFKKMLTNYSNAFVYAWFHPKIGLWMGATPERLLTIKNGHFKTMALAGTQSYKGTTEVFWEEKEKEEQKIVTDYIIENLKNKVDIKDIIGPYTINAGSLLHLRTDLTGKLTNLKLIKDLVELLHPTPAVCGLPKEISYNFILENENYKRTYYTGYLGELNINNETQLFVNLRCMEILKNCAKIFVGGGITADSNANNEFEETVSKSFIMKKVL